MNAEGHKSKAEEIGQSLQELLPDPKGKNVVAIVELCSGIVQHLIAYGLEEKHREHIDTHIGLPKLLRNLKEEENIVELLKANNTNFKTIKIWK